MNARRRFACAALLLAALPVRAQDPFAKLLEGPAEAPVEVDADAIDYTWDKKILKLEGHVVAHRGEGTLRADHGLLDRENGKLTLEGNVLGIQGRQVFLADGALVDLNEREATFAGLATLYLKEKPANPDAPKSGKNALILHGKSVRETAKGVYLAHDVTITPCDCAGAPDYQIEAEDARIEGDRAHLHGVDLDLLGASLPLFPLDLPLTSRQWGLLAPQLLFSGVAGFGYAQPIFLPVSDSMDFTVAPGFYTGGTNAADPALGARDIKGPSLALEWRYAPVEGTRGSIALDTFYDLDQHHSPDVPSLGQSAGRGFDGFRGTAHLLHRSEGDAGVFAVQGTIASDAMVVQDAEPASLDRLVDYLRTDIGAWRARGATTVGFDAAFLQDVRIPDGNDPDRRLFGAERRTTFQRLPSLFAQVAPVPLGDVSFALDASVAAFAPFAGPDAGEHATGFGPTDLGSGAPPLNVDAARAPAVRADFAPRLAWAAQGPLQLSLDAGGRLDGYVFDGYPDRDRTRAYVDAGAQIALPLERRFGDTLHRLTPGVELRAISPSLQHGGPPIGDEADAGGAQYASSIASSQQGLAPAPGAAPDGQQITGVPSARRAYDELDFAAPSTGALEAVFSLANSLWRKQGKTAARWLRLDLQQDMLFGSYARLGEGSAIASAQASFGAISAMLRYDWALRAVSAVGANGSIHDARTDELHASTLLLRGSSSERLRAGIDELFSAARLDAPAGSISGSAGFGASAPIVHGLRLSYDFTRNLSEVPLPLGFPDTVHAAGISLETACHCAAISLSAAFQLYKGELLNHRPVLHFVLDLKSLGSFATF